MTEAEGVYMRLAVYLRKEREETEPYIALGQLDWDPYRSAFLPPGSKTGPAKVVRLVVDKSRRRTYRRA